jgi:hypothetical protein
MCAACSVLLVTSDWAISVMTRGSYRGLSITWAGCLTLLDTPQIFGYAESEKGDHMPILIEYHWVPDNRLIPMGRKPRRVQTVLPHHQFDPITGA